MSTFKLRGTAQPVTENAAIAAQLQAASEREAQRFQSVCTVPDGATVHFVGLFSQEFENGNDNGNFLLFRLADESGATFDATAKMFRPRHKVQPFAEGGELRTVGIVPANATSQQIYDALTATTRTGTGRNATTTPVTFRLRNLRDFYASGVEMLSSFVGIEPL
jgi:hypothetical protein